MDGQYNSYGQDFVLGFDVSKYQDLNSTAARPDFKKMRAEGGRFCVVRVNENTNADEDFDYNFKAIQDSDMLPICYSFLEYRSGIAKPGADQAMTCFDLISKANGGVTNNVTVYLDFERPNANWAPLPSQSASIALLSRWYEVGDVVTGKLCGLYGNRSTIYAITPVPARTLTRPLWIAAYPFDRLIKAEEIEKISWRPSVTPWSKFRIWQAGFTDGYKYGMESKEVDIDYYAGTIEDLYEDVSNTIPPIVGTLSLQDQINKVAEEIEKLKQEMKDHGWTIW